MKKIILLLLAGFCIITHPALSQVSPSDTTSFHVENPMQMVPKQYKVLGVDVKGLTTTRPSFVISQAGFQKGSTITIPGSDISKAIKRLYKTGLFSNVAIIKKKSTSNGIYLEIDVQEQPRLRNYKLRGIKGSQRKDLRDQINLLPGFAITQSSKAQAVQTIRRFYAKKGYWYTKVHVSTGKLDTVRNRETLYFDVDPGKKLEIKDITFSGNKHFSDATLRKALGSIKEDKWWKFFSKKLYKEKDYEKAKKNLRKFYLKHGYLDFQITQDTVYTFPYIQHRLFVFKTPATGLKVHMNVSEGPQYKVRNITWEGNTVYTDQQLTQTLGFQKGDVFNEEKFDKNLNYNQSNSDVTSLYENHGYLFFQVNPKIEVVGKDSVDIHLMIDENKIATVKKVSFSGNTKTNDDVVRRTIRTIPGDKYNRSAIVRTIRELGTLGYFRPQSIKPNLQPDQQNHTVNINYSMDESQSTDNFQFSGGYGGSNIGLILSAKVQFNNFSLQRAIHGKGWDPVPSGDGQKLSLAAQVSGTGYQSYSIGFQEPYLNGKPSSLGLNLSYDLIRRYGNAGGKNKLFSSSVSLGKRLKWPDDYFTARTVLSYELYDVKGGVSYLPAGASNILSLKEVITRNSLDNKISPTRGSKLKLSAEIAPPFPGFSQYFKIKTLYQDHMTIIGKLVLTNTIQYGYMGYLIPGHRSNFKRFVLGGTQLQQRQDFINDDIDLRGYPGGTNGSISPVSYNPNTGVTQNVGGRIFSKYSMELRIPAVNEKKVQIYPYTFFDAGNSYLNFRDFSPFNVKRSTGFGVRIYLPILGLVDLSYGYRLDGIPNNNNVNAGQWEFLFNMGAPF